MKEAWDSWVTSREW